MKQIRSNINNELTSINNSLKFFSDQNIKIFKKLIKESQSKIKKKKIIFCGNGGSASHAQHLACELVVRYKIERIAINALSLTTDTSNLTAIGNDYHFDYIFSRQLEAVGNKGDICIFLTTSGQSKNLLNAAKVAKKKKFPATLFLVKEVENLKS